MDQQILGISDHATRTEPPRAQGTPPLVTAAAGRGMSGTSSISRNRGDQGRHGPTQCAAAHDDWFAANAAPNRLEEMAMSAVIPLHAPRIVPDPPGGWFVVFGSFGWLYGSRREALIACRDLTVQQ
jgi:hypothetical protein